MRDYDNRHRVFLNLCGSFLICVEFGRTERLHMGVDQFDAGRLI